ncbi:hypothetical protein niasHT_007114 [Heterodera trifolii]|uniref:Effector protein n=1 Tax=Heterodera trifolii TaxID=157864 RepID=A0ABD2LXN3_9BILA
MSVFVFLALGSGTGLGSSSRAGTFTTTPWRVFFCGGAPLARKSDIIHSFRPGPSNTTDAIYYLYEKYAKKQHGEIQMQKCAWDKLVKPIPLLRQQIKRQHGTSPEQNHFANATFPNCSRPKEGEKMCKISIFSSILHLSGRLDLQRERRNLLWDRNCLSEIRIIPSPPNHGAKSGGGLGTGGKVLFGVRSTIFSAAFDNSAETEITTTKTKRPEQPSLQFTMVPVTLSTTLRAGQALSHAALITLRHQIISLPSHTAHCVYPPAPTYPCTTSGPGCVIPPNPGLRIPKLLAIHRANIG